jgi:hypothetical protein
MRTVIWAGLVLALAGCSGEDASNLFASGPADNGQGSDSDASVSSPDAAGVPCGTRSCNPNEYCCDGKCGACMPVGMNCPATPCP